MQSNVCEKSVKTAPILLCSYRVLHHFSIIAKRQFCALEPFETHTEMWRILHENMDRFGHTLVSHELYSD